MRSPFRIRVYDKTFAFLFQLPDPDSVSLTVRHLAKGTAVIVVPVGHRRAAALMAPGVRVAVDYLTSATGPYNSDASWLRVISGPIWTREADGGTRNGTLTLGVEDDFRLLETVLAWPNAALNVNAQPVSRTISGPAETVIKTIVAENLVARLGAPVTVSADLGRGQSVSVSLRFDVLADSLLPLATVGGLGIRISQNVIGSGFVFDVYQPTDRTAQPLSEASGTLLDWKLQTTGPTVTRVVVGGGGDGALRGFTLTTDSARESEWGVKVETFADASSATTAADLSQAAAAALSVGQASAGFSVTAAETDIVRFGKNLFVGDLIRVRISDSLDVSDVLSSCSLAWTDDAGLTVTPQVGSGSASQSPDAVLARAVSRLYTGVRKLRSYR